MNYIKINNDGTSIFPYDLQSLRNENPNTILPVDIPIDVLEANNIYPVTYLAEPAHNKDSQYTIKQDVPVFLNNIWSIGYDIIEYSLVEKEEKIRATRDDLLSYTDWTQLADIPDAIKQTWQPYRQALRDITNQVGFPDSVIWPTKPE